MGFVARYRSLSRMGRRRHSWWLKRFTVCIYSYCLLLGLFAITIVYIVDFTRTFVDIFFITSDPYIHVPYGNFPHVNVTRFCEEALEWWTGLPRDYCKIKEMSWIFPLDLKSKSRVVMLPWPSPESPYSHCMARQMFQKGLVNPWFPTRKCMELTSRKMPSDSSKPSTDSSNPIADSL